jgi:hypothetical protein
MRSITHPVVGVALALSLAACERGSKSDISIPEAKNRAALSLGAFECSHLATEQADTSRLFNIGVRAGRDFLGFAEQNRNGYRSIAGELDPAWTRIESRPSVDFKLGELHAITIARALSWRGRWSDAAWERRRADLYRERNCALLVLPPAKD